MKTLIFPTVLIFAVLSAATAAPLVLAYNSVGTELRDNIGVPLYNGSTFVSSGDVLEIGYFTLATSSDPFAGNWISLISRAIGDKSTPRFGPGLFRIQDSIDPSSLLGGTPLAIRFYDAPLLRDATYYNTVSDASGAWNWDTAFSEEPLMLSLADSTLVWQDGSGSAFRTTIPIPEPTGLSLAAGMAFFLTQRRRRDLIG